jgi:hypothetical protein
MAEDHGQFRLAPVVQNNNNGSWSATMRVNGTAGADLYCSSNSSSNSSPMPRPPPERRTPSSGGAARSQTTTRSCYVDEQRLCKERTDHELDGWEDKPFDNRPAFRRARGSGLVLDTSP